MGNYNIRFAVYEDIPDIMNFIECYWKASHVLASNREFFEYEHRMGERVNFALAVDSELNGIQCICGFLQSCEDISKGCVWEVIWIKKPGAPRGVGVDVMDFIAEKSGAPYNFIVGANPATVPLHVARGYLVGKLQHYYRLNANIDSYKIAKITCKQILSCDTSTPIQLVPVAKGDVLKKIIEEIPQQKPHKDYWYINKRYVNHPVYRYGIWGLQHADGKINALLVTRIVNAEMGSALRIIDYLGLHSDMSFIGREIERILFENNCEYADIYCYGVDEEYLLRMGFVKKAKDDSNIIPNYFEPFVRKNVDLTFISSLNDGFSIFKGDADQDRPNVL